MVQPAHILIADDEPIVRESTADLLRQQGYQCTAVPDARAALECLRKSPCDLLIADIRMEGNLHLELIKELAQVAEGMPVILVTGYPSVQTAIDAIQLPVVAYLVKPLQFDEFLEAVRGGVERCRFYRSVCAAQQRAEVAGQELRNVAESLRAMPKDILAAPLTNFLTLTLQNIRDGLSDVERLTNNLMVSKDPELAQEVAERSLLKLQRNLLEEVVDTLDKTKSAFKSKELGQLRKRVEEALRFF